MANGKVSIIIPALNEERAIAKLISEIPISDIKKTDCLVEIIVVDNNSTDRTREIASETGAKVITEPIKGKGRAIRRGFELASGDFIFMLDADYTYPATYIPKMLEILKRGEDVVIGSRLKGQMGKGAMSRMNLIGNHLLAFMASILYQTKISDLCTGYWGLTRKAINDLELDATGFDLEVQMFINLTKKGYKLAEVPINYRRRITPPNLRALRDGLKIGWVLFKKRFR